jgi:protein SCO1/2
LKSTFGLIGAALAAALATAAPALGHSLHEVEENLMASERFVAFEPLSFPESDLRTIDGAPIGMDAFAGKVVVLTFVYTNCPDICPLHSELIAGIQADVNATPMKDLVAFVSISTDPENDTPEAMRAYPGQHGLDPTNWQFLASASPTATRDLALALRQKFTPDGEGYQQHIAVTYVIDREGFLRARYFGLRFEPSSLILYVNALANDEGEHDPTATPPPTAKSIGQRFRAWLGDLF